MINDFYHRMSTDSPNYIRQHNYLVLDREEYSSLYRNSNASVKGDASTTYLLEYKEAIKNIHKYCGTTVKIIFILRQPIKRLISQYKYIVELGFENLHLKEALMEEEIRLSKSWSSIYMYKRQGLYSQGIKSFKSTFPNVQVVFFEELIQRPQEVMNSVFDFLEIKRIPVKMDYGFNQSGLPVNRVLHNLLLNKNVLRTGVARLMRLFLNDSKLLSYRDRIRKLNQKSNHVLQLDSELESLLVEYYSQDIRNLKEVLNRDLPWEDIQW